MSVQANNVVVKKSVHPAREEGGLLNHVDLVQLLDIVDLEAGTAVAGNAFAVAVSPIVDLEAGTTVARDAFTVGVTTVVD